MSSAPNALTSTNVGARDAESPISKAIDYGLTFLIAAISALSGNNYKTVFNKNLSDHMPFVATGSFVMLVLAKLLPSNTIQTILTGLGFYLCSVLVVISVLSKECTSSFWEFAVFVLALIPMIGYFKGVSEGIPSTRDYSNRWGDELLKQGWRIIGIAFFAVIAGHKLESETSVTLISLYAGFAYTIFLQATFMPGIRSACVAWLSLVPLVATAMIGDRYPLLLSTAVMVTGLAIGVAFVLAWKLDSLYRMRGIGIVAHGAI